MTLFQLIDTCYNLGDNEKYITLYVYDKPVELDEGEKHCPTKDELLGSDYYRKYLDYSVTGFAINGDIMVVDLIRGENK